MTTMEDATGYRLLDCGRGRRLEAFGRLVVDRPAPMADGNRRGSGHWADAITYRAGRGWADTGGARPDETSWPVDVAGVTLEAQLGPGGQVGVFPEHAGYAAWVRDAVAARIGGAGSPDSRDANPETAGSAPEVLNLFAHTGLLSLVAARAGARVTHLDASRPAVQSARRNADLSSLNAYPIRWIVDDAMAFVHREVRRGRRYDGFVIDPPTYGHGARGTDDRGWLLDRDLAPLLEACHALANDDGFWVLSAHTPAWDGRRLATALEDAALAGARARPRRLEIEAESGAVLTLGWVAFLDPLRPDPR